MNKPKTEQRTDQTLSLSPQHLINANILQLNSAMLEVRLYKELESNPALEIIESEPDIDNDKTDEEDNQEDGDFEVKSSIDSVFLRISFVLIDHGLTLI